MEENGKEIKFRSVKPIKVENAPSKVENAPTNVDNA